MGAAQTDLLYHSGSSRAPHPFLRYSLFRFAPSQAPTLKEKRKEANYLSNHKNLIFTLINKLSTYHSPFSAILLKKAFAMCENVRIFAVGNSTYAIGGKTPENVCWSDMRGCRIADK